MNRKTLIAWIPAALAIFGLFAIWFWWNVGSTNTIKPRLPGADGAQAGSLEVASIKWEGTLVLGKGVVPTNVFGIWPCFRGPVLSGISLDTTPLAKSWPPTGPKALWRIDVDEGYAGAAIWKGRVFLLDYDPKTRADALRCLWLADGQEIWRYTYPVKLKSSHGRSRTVPTVTEKHVISLGPKGNVVCLDQTSGELRWQMNLANEFHAKIPQWYVGQCPMVEGDRLILGTGGDALVVAVDCQSGSVVWKSPNPYSWQMTHSSVTPITFKGQRMYVYCAGADIAEDVPKVHQTTVPTNYVNGGVVGVSAEDGRILWSAPSWNIKMATVPSPVDISDGRVFLSGGYGAGSMMIQLTENRGTFLVRSLFRLKPKVFGSTQHTPIFFKDHLFGVRESPDDQLVCLDLAGNVVWTSGPDRRFRGGPYLIAQGLIFVLSEDGVLTLVEANTSGYKELARAKVLQGPFACGPMALADGRLILRDFNEMICLDVSGKREVIK